MMIFGEGLVIYFGGSGDRFGEGFVTHFLQRNS